MSSIKSINEVLTGMFLILVSLFAFYASWRLSTVTEVGLGPGFVPRMFAVMQLVLGALLVLTGFLQVGEAPEPWRLRPLIVLAGVAFFGMAIERMGLVIALTGLVLVSCAANRGTRVSEALAIAVGSVVFSIVVFVKLLGLVIPLWPTFLWS